MRVSRWSRFLFPAIMAALSDAAHSACTPPPVIDRDYIDSEPGWRVRAITPILKSRAFKPELNEATAADGSLQISVGR